MKRFDAATLSALLLSALTSSPGLAHSGVQQPVVVELFTSQGCSSCPPADANLITLMNRPDVLALSFAVTYWDRLGWKDIFGKQEFTERQVVYERPLGQGGPFTPQIVVGGRATTVGNSLSDVEALIGHAETGGWPEVKLASDRVRIGAGSAPAGGADVWLVRYEPGIINVPVKRGENSGRTLPLGHVVRDLARIGVWTGQEASFAVPPAAANLRTAILVQERNGGPILSAATNRPGGGTE
jgi:hypothetical protein